MKKNTQIYLNAFGYDLSDANQYVPCEISGQRGVDIHHIVDREDRIENLMMLTRKIHSDYGEVKSKMWFLLDAHREFLIVNGVQFDNEWFEVRLAKYEAYIND